MFDKLKEVEARYQELERLLADPEVISRQSDFRKLSKEHSDISELVECYRRYARIEQELDDNKQLLDEKDAELKAMARDEISRLSTERTAIEERLKVLLLPRDPNDEKNIL